MEKLFPEIVQYLAKSTLHSDMFQQTQNRCMTESMQNTINQHYNKNSPSRNKSQICTI